MTVVSSPATDIARRYQRRSLTMTAVALAVVIVAAAVALTFPGAGIDRGEALRALAHPGEGLASTVVFTWRMPRVAAAIAVGAGLAVAGALFQTLTRNPLGSPDIIGFNTGAYTGVIVVSFMGFSSFINVAMGAMIGGGLTAATIVALALRRELSGMRLILVGIGVSLTLAAFNRWLILRGDLDTAMTAATWAAGSLNGMAWDFAGPAVSALGVAVAAALCLGPVCEALELDDDNAHSVGLRVSPARVGLVAISALLTALSTALAGPISFVALAAPHISRFLTGGQRAGLATCAATGSALVLACDILAQRLFAPTMLPVGVVTVTLGGIYLVILMLISSSRR